MVERHFSHVPTITGLFLLIFGIFSVLGTTGCYEFWELDGKLIVLFAVLAFVGFILFYKGMGQTLRNWYWWHFGLKGTLAVFAIGGIIALIFYTFYTGGKC